MGILAEIEICSPCARCVLLDICLALIILIGGKEVQVTAGSGCRRAIDLQLACITLFKLTLDCLGMHFLGE